MYLFLPVNTYTLTNHQVRLDMFNLKHIPESQECFCNGERDERMDKLSDRVAITPGSQYLIRTLGTVRRY